jgi:hypothetical protein
VEASGSTPHWCAKDQYSVVHCTCCRVAAGRTRRHVMGHDAWSASVNCATITSEMADRGGGGRPLWSTPLSLCSLHARNQKQLGRSCAKRATVERAVQGGKKVLTTSSTRSSRSRSGKQRRKQKSRLGVVRPGSGVEDRPKRTRRHRSTDGERWGARLTRAMRFTGGTAPGG